MSERTHRPKLTGKQLAAMLNVSPATVSNALNGHDSRVSEETKYRIIQAAKKYGYQPPQKAKQPRTSNRVIIFMVLSEHLNNWFVGNLRGIADTCRKHQYALVQLLFPLWDRNYCVFVIQKMNPMGAIVICTPHHPMLKELEHYNVPYVTVDCYDEQTEFNAVHLDNFGGAYDATSYLIGLGHRHIGLLSGGDVWPSAIYRKKGYIQALTDRGLPFEQKLIYNGGFTQFGGYLGAKILLDTNPDLTAVFAVSDEMALGAIRAISDLGLDVPQDISIVGFDGIVVGQNIQPSLTTIETDPYSVGSNACAMLIGMLESGSKQVAKVLMDVRLVIRNTTGNIDARINPHYKAKVGD